MIVARLSGNLRVDPDLAGAAKPAEADVRPGGRVAGNLRQPLRPADRGDVFVENLGRGGPDSGRLGEEDVVALLGRRTVHDVHGRRHERFVAVAMAGPAGHDLAAVEVVLVDGLDHRDHLPRGPLDRIVGRPIDVVGAGRFVTVGAVERERRAHDAHRAHEVVHRDALEHLDVLECFIRQERAVPDLTHLRRRSGRRRLRAAPGWRGRCRRRRRSWSGRLRRLRRNATAAGKPDDTDQPHHTEPCRNNPA
jgi:hypothetical protein